MGLIATGDLKPGQRLPSERELCVRFGTGRSSLREALRCLSIVGVLNARVGEGTSIAVNGDKFLGKILEWRLITEQHDIENLMQVRIGLEGLAAASAARTGSEENIRALETLLGNTRAAHRLLAEALTIMRNWPPSSITTDKLRSYPEATGRLQRDHQLSRVTRHRTSKYLNNIIEADHGALKQVIKPTRGFQSMKTTTATIKGFEIMRMIRRGHCLTCKPGVGNEIRFVNQLFHVAA